MKTCRISYSKISGWSTEQLSSDSDSENTLVMAFCSSALKNHTALQELGNLLPRSTIVGCSTAGEINGSQVHDGSISVGIMKFDRSSFKKSCHFINNGSNATDLGSQIARDLIADDLKAILIFCDGLHINGSSLVEGLYSGLGGKSVAIAGGLAADGDQFQETWVLDGQSADQKKVIAVGLYGKDLSARCLSKNGWDIFGPERVVTRSTGNVVYEIDGRPALSVYREYLGDRARELPVSGLMFPLQIRRNRLSENQIIRTLLSIDESQSSLIFAGDVPEGHTAQLMRYNTERLINSAEDVGESLKINFETSESISLAVSCVGRRLVLGQRVDEEVGSLSHSLGYDNIVGFYSYGQIGSGGREHLCELHNQTLTVLNISENLKNLHEAS